MNELPLYFIAIIPPDPVYAFAQQQKEYFRERFNSKAALKSPPHITLHMPFRVKKKKEALLIQTLETLADGHYCFELEVNGFGAFEPRVIYLNISKPDPLVELQREVGLAMKTELNLFNANYKDQVFNPHLTVAFRDLKKPMFYEAWQDFKEKGYKISFQVETLTLLKHDGSRWEVCRSFPLKLIAHSKS